MSPHNHSEMTNGEISTLLAMICGQDPEDVTDFVTIVLLPEGKGVRAIINTSMEDPDCIELLARSINHLIRGCHNEHD